MGEWGKNKVVRGNNFLELSRHAQNTSRFLKKRPCKIKGFCAG